MIACELGNVTLIRDIPSGDERTLTWDHRNQLVSVIHRGASTDEARYHYDVLGRKVGEEITAGGTSEQTSYVYEGQSIVLEIDQTTGSVTEDQITRSYLNGLLPNEVLAVDQHVTGSGTETVWLFADTVGTVRSMGHVDAAKAWTIAHRSFDEHGQTQPFRDEHGKVIVTTNDLLCADDAFLTATPTIWAGHLFDDISDLYDMKARWYDPTSHRFLTEDPAKDDTNLYRYGAGDPVNNVDPDGRVVVVGTLLAGAAIYVGYSALSAAGELAIESAAIHNFGTDEEILNFSHVNTFGKNFAINLATGGIGGKVKAVSTLGRVAKHAVHYAGRQSIEIGGDTAYDVYANDRDFTSSLLVNTASSVLGEAGGRTLIAGGRRAFNRNFQITLDTNGVYAGSLFGGLAGVKVIRKLEPDDFRLGRAGGSVTPAKTGKQLLPGEGAVGTYDELITAGTKGDNITPHHIPSANHMRQHGVSRGSGIAINMEQSVPGLGGRQRQTFTYGTRADEALSPRDALGRGVRDAKRIYESEGLYGPSIRNALLELIRRNRNSNPGLFDKGL